MSLDSVELILYYEEYFQVQITDEEALQVVKVQDLIDLAMRLRRITDESAPLKALITEKVLTVLQKMGLGEPALSMDERIFLRLRPEDPQQWERFCSLIEMVIPKPHLGGGRPQSGLLGPVYDYIWRVRYSWSALTLAQFVTAICVANYKVLLDQNALRNAFEVYVAVVAILVEKMGIDVYDVGPNDNFANDLGID